MIKAFHFGLKKRSTSLLLCFFTLFFVQNLMQAQPIRLHPQNPHYFDYRGKPTILLTSAAHYGQVINLDYDYVAYLSELQRNGLNYTRIFAGSYIEAVEAIPSLGPNNILSPKPNRFITPWARSTTPGNVHGGNKFDLDKWDPTYFARLKDFITKANERGIVVEVTLFCPFYKDMNWNLSPFKSTNNINNVGNLARTSVHILDNGGLLSYQEKMVAKIVTELKDFDNIFYEICNEPYFDNVALDWQYKMISTIVNTESTLPKKHLIAQNVFNFHGKVTNPHSAVSIFNYHYAESRAVSENFWLNKVLGFDETGFAGPHNDDYREAGWRFFMAGGALYNNLDWTFTTSSPKGEYALPPDAPGGGGVSLRNELKVLRDFINSFDFIKMSPKKGVVNGGVPSGGYFEALVEVGKAYAIYLVGGTGTALSISLPAGIYRAEWINTKTGTIEKTENFSHTNGNKSLASPAYPGEIALRIKAVSGTSEDILEGYYKLVAKHSNKILDVKGASKLDDIPIQQWVDNGTPAQQWKIVPVGEGYFKLISVNSNKCLDVRMRGATNGTPIIQWTDNGTIAQRWKIEATEDGYYRLVTEVSGKVMQLSSTLHTDGVKVNTWDWNNSDHQKWKLVPIAGPSLRSTNLIEENATEKAQTCMFPNPAQNQVTVNYKASNQGVTSILITDLLSNTQLKQQHNSKPGINTIQINTTSLEEGIYFIHINAPGNTIKQRLTIAR